MYWTLAPGCGGTIYTNDGGDEWVFNRYFGPGEKPRIDDPVALIKGAIGGQIEVEVVSALDWTPRQLVADSYGVRRVFLAGDACHLFVPTGGFGMNTGIGDVVDLAWKIEATLAGWGGPMLMGSYDRERRPIGLQNTLEAADNYARSGNIFSATGDIEDEGPRPHRRAPWLPLRGLADHCSRRHAAAAVRCGELCADGATRPSRAPCLACGRALDPRSLRTRICTIVLRRTG